MSIIINVYVSVFLVSSDIDLIVMGHWPILRFPAEFSVLVTINTSSTILGALNYWYGLDVCLSGFIWPRPNCDGSSILLSLYDTCSKIFIFYILFFYMNSFIISICRQDISECFAKYHKHHLNLNIDITNVCFRNTLFIIRLILMIFTVHGSGISERCVAYTTEDDILPWSLISSDYLYVRTKIIYSVLPG